MQKNIAITLAILLLGCKLVSAKTDSSFYLKLKALPFEKITSLETGKFFTERYEIIIEQPLDHNNPDRGTFPQRFFIAHNNKARPVVVITAGYDVDYADRPLFINELTSYLDANQITIEHRFYSVSTPDSIQWQYLNIENAAYDQHRIIQLLKPLYESEWVSTGISKGGQTAMYHRYFFPDDVDATVGFVCPLNFSDEDLRVYTFLDQVGDSVCRRKIHDYQRALLERKNECLPIFDSMAKEKNVHWSGGMVAGFEFLVLEYSFAHWQWGKSCDQLPPSDSKPKKMVDHLVSVTGLDWGTVEGTAELLPFFYQAITEIGMYGYDLSEFEGLITALEDNTFDFTCPDGVNCIFNPVPMQMIDHFIRHEAKNILLIYGEWDAWSATAVQWSGNPGVVKIVKPEGSHLTRISNLPEKQRQLVFSTLEKWLGVEIISK